MLGTGLEDFFDSAYGFSIIAPGYDPAPTDLYPGKLTGNLQLLVIWAYSDGLRRAHIPPQGDHSHFRATTL